MCRRPEQEGALFVFDDLAEKGEILENEQGTFLVLVDGSLHRHQASRRDPNIVKFERYAFDLSQFSNPNQAKTLSVRERLPFGTSLPPRLTIPSTSRTRTATSPSCTTA